MILDGKKVAEKFLNITQEKISKMDKKPHLAVILVGNDPASQVYVRNKQKAAKKVGIQSTLINLEETTEESRLLEIIEKLNNDNDITGILVQLPLPKQIDKNKPRNCRTLSEI